jgi:hypothetical protein
VSSYVNEVLLPFLVFLLAALCLLPRRLPTIELLDDLRTNTIELFLREDTKQGPGEVERVEDRPAFVGAWSMLMSTSKTHV